MVKHIVLFQLRKELSEEIRLKVALDFKKAIEELPVIIPVIQKIQVGMNINPDETWDICLDSTFETMEDVKIYASHEAHQKVALQLKPYVNNRSCVDYEY